MNETYKYFGVNFDQILSFFFAMLRIFLMLFRFNKLDYINEISRKEMRAEEKRSNCVHRTRNLFQIAMNEKKNNPNGNFDLI